MKRLRWQLQHVLRSVGLPGWVAIALALSGAVGWWEVTVPLRDETRRLATDSARLEQRLVDRRLVAASDAAPQQQLEAFARRFPGEKGIATALKRLHAAAHRQGMQLDVAEFRFANEPAEPLSRYSIVLPIKADYRALRRFTREALRELPGLALEEANLRRADAKSTQLEAQLRFVLFVAKGN